MKIRRHPRETLSLSFLDVLTCGMGACVLLFLALSAVRNHPGRPLYVDDFIQAQWQLNSRNAVVALRVTLHTDRGDTPFLINRPADEDLNGAPLPIPTRGLAQNIYMFGHTQHAYADRIEELGEGNPVVMVLHLHNPKAGCWTVEPVIVDFADLGQRVLQGTGSPEVQFTSGWVSTRSGIQLRLGTSQTVGLGESVKWDNAARRTCGIRISRKHHDVE